MIAYFPVPYPDELLFSTICRGREHSGIYAAHAYFYQLLETTGSVHFNMRYYNQFSKETVAFLGGDSAIRSLVMQHTLYPYDMRFACYEFRKDFYDTLPLGKSYGRTILRQKKESFLRYCPVCVEQDRKTYGETYWHRSHQMETVEFCPEHGVKLLETDIRISGRANIRTQCMIAESYVIDGIHTQGTEEQWRYARYQSQILAGEHFLQNENFISYLSQFLKTTCYTTQGGEIRLLKELDRDCKHFYQIHGIPYMGTPERIRSIFKKHFRNSLIITQVAYFLGIPAEMVILPRKETRTENQLQQDIISFVKGGSSYRKASKVFHIGASTVARYCKEAGVESSYKNKKPNTQIHERIQIERNIWLQLIAKYPGKTVTQISSLSNENRRHIRWLREHDKEWTNVHMPRAVKVNVDEKWSKLDRKYLPMVKMAIKKLQNSQNGVPTCISIRQVAKMIGCKESELYSKLPKCKEVVEKHRMDTETIIIRKLEYAVHCLQAQQQKISFSAISRQGGPYRNSILRIQELIFEKADEETKKLIKELMRRTGYI